MRQILVMSALLAVLTGCAGLTPAERAEQMQQEVDEMIQVYGPACTKLGYTADTDPWRECILKLNARRQAELAVGQPTMTHCWGHRGFMHCSTF